MTTILQNSYYEDNELYTPAIAEDLINGLNEWHNTQEIVRLTFKALSDVIRAQGNAIRDLESELSSKVSSYDLQQSLQSKANVQDVTKSLSEICTVLETKVDIQEVQDLVQGSRMDRRYMNDSYHTAVTEDEIHRIYSILDKKANSADVMEALQNKANKQSVANALHRKANRNEVESLVQSKAEITELQGVIDALDRKVDKNEIDRINRGFQDGGFKQNAEKLLQEMQDALSYVRNTSSNIGTDVKEQIQKLSKQVNYLESNYSNVSTYIQQINQEGRGVTYHEFDEAINSLRSDMQYQNKLNQNHIHDLMHSHTKEQQNTESNTIAYQLKEQIQSKASKYEIDALQNQINQQLELIGKDLLMKANIKDICTLLDVKANIDEVNRSFESVYQQFRSIGDFEEIHQFISDQAIVNEALCAENCVARWLWKSGRTQSGKYIPWEIQSVNTCPDNFIWEKDNTSILAIAPGLYELSFGFFIDQSPTVQILINGEPILNLGGERTWSIHSAGNVAGLSNIQFVALPARARVSICISVDYNVEGFLGLRKL